MSSEKVSESLAQTQNLNNNQPTSSRLKDSYGREFFERSFMDKQKTMEHENAFK